MDWWEPIKWMVLAMIASAGVELVLDYVLDTYTSLRLGESYGTYIEVITAYLLGKHLLEKFVTR
ncbi:hypothetical protein KKG66_06395 [bacterium]|nr:hypothetical protein [bacterium]